MAGPRIGLGIILLLVLISSSTLAAGAAQSQNECNPIQEVEICIESVELSSNVVETDEDLTITVVVKNYGEETGGGYLLFGIEQPTGERNFGSPRTIELVEPGEQREITYAGPVRNGGRLGTHQLNLMLFDTSQQHLFDATGYYETLTIRESDNGFNLLSWLKGLHYTIQIGMFVIPILLVAMGRK